MTSVRDRALEAGAQKAKGVDVCVCVLYICPHCPSSFHRSAGYQHRAGPCQALELFWNPWMAEWIPRYLSYLPPRIHYLGWLVAGRQARWHVDSRTGRWQMGKDT